MATAPQGWAQGGTAPSKPAGKPAAPAPAAPAAPGDPDAEAAKLYSDGVKAEVAGHLERARELLSKSFELKPTPETALHLGRVELRTTKYLTLFLEQAQGVSALERKTTEKQLAEAKSKLGTVTVRVELDGAEVLVDGQPVGNSPRGQPLTLEPGAWQFEARKDGCALSRQSVSVKPGEALEVVLKLAPPAVAPVKPPVVDDDTGPAKPPETTPGTAPETPHETPLPTPPPPKWRTWAMIGGAGLTAIGLGVGVRLTVGANGKSKEADARLAAMKKTTPTTYTISRILRKALRAFAASRSSSSGGASPAERGRIERQLRPRFTSTRLGDPGYAQLAADCAAQIREGGEDCSEMGAFSHLKQRQRSANLHKVLEEYLPVNLQVGFFLVT